MKGKGLAAAAMLSPEHANAIEDMKEQLLFVLVNRLGGKVVIPVSEIDDTGNLVMMMSLDQQSKAFTFEVRKKD